MKRKDEIKRLWSEGLKLSPEYLDMYFDRIYHDDDALVTEVDGRVASCLLLQPFRLWFYGAEPLTGYITGAVTKRQMRGRGLMTDLMLRALDESARRGYMMCEIVPNHDWIYPYFSRFGFSDIFLTDTQRFTSLHPFATVANYHALTDAYAPAVYDAYSRYQRERQGCVLLSERDFINSLDEIALSPEGIFVAVGRKDCPVASMAWASTDDDGTVIVHELAGIDADARTGALHELRSHFPDRPLRYNAPSADAGTRRLVPCAMGRIIDVHKCLSIIAGANPMWRAVIRVTDPLLPHNNHVYRISGGQCDIVDGPMPKLDFDVAVEVLAKIVFSSPETGEMLGFPSRRTHIALMPGA